MSSCRSRRCALLSLYLFLLGAYEAGSFAASLVADYRLEGKLTSSVAGAPELDIQRTDIAQFVQTDVKGASRSALALPSGAQIRLNTTGILARDHFSIALLVAPDSVSSYVRLVDVQDPGQGTGWFLVNGHNSDNPTGDSGAAALADHAFTQLVFTKDGPSARVYVNGALDLSFTDSSDWMKIGANGIIWLLGQADGSYSSGGKVARIRLYQGALTDAEAAALDNLAPASTPSPSGANVVADYRFESSLKSATAGAPDAMVEGGDYASFVVDTVGGSSRTVLDFRLGSGVLINTSGLLDAAHYSVVALFALANVSSYERIFDPKDPTDVTGGFNLNGAIGWHPQIYFPTPTLTNGVYTQVTYVVDGKFVRIFQGGTKLLDLIDLRQHGIISSNVVRFFRGSDGAYAPGGRVARVRLVAGVLTDAEVAALAPLADPPGPPSATPVNPVADYQFLENLQSSVAGAPDLTPEGKNLSFVSDVIGTTEVTALQLENGVGVGFNPTGLLDPESYTISLLFEMNSVASYQRIFDVRTPGDQSGLFVVNGAVGLNPTVFTAGPVLSNHTYAHLVLVKDGQYVRIFRDGSKVLDVVDLHDYEKVSGNLIHILRSADGSYGPGGRIARLRAFNTPLNDAQAAALVALSPAVPPAGSGAALVADYQFQDNLHSSVAGAPDIIPTDPADSSFENSAYLEGKRIFRFPNAQGLRLPTKGLVDPRHYTLALAFEFDNVGGYQRILDAKDPSDPQGWYVVNGVVSYLSTPYSSDPLLGANQFIELVLVVDGAECRLYESGQRRMAFFDFDEHSSIGDAGVLSLFRGADGSYGPGGRVARVRLFNGSLNDLEVAAVPASVPGRELTSIPPGANVDLAFNGGFLDVPTTNTLRAPFTVEFWAFPTNDGTDGVLGSRQPAESGFDVKFSGRGHLHADIGDGAGWITTSADCDLPQPATNWTHVAYAVSSDSYVIYVNASPIVTNTLGGSSLPLLYDPSHQLRIGDSYGGEVMAGQVDEVRIWNRARAGAEIAGDYNRVLHGNEPGLVNYYRFSEGKGLVTHDLAAAGGDDAAIFAAGGSLVRWVATGPDLVDAGTAASDWDAARDLRRSQLGAAAQASANPNPLVRAWTYGYRLESPLASMDFTPYTSDEHYTNIAGSFQLSGFYHPPSDGPAIGANVGSDPVVISFCCGPLVPIQTNELAVWPGQSGIAAVARWTAPAAGDYRLRATWHKTDVHGGSGCQSAVVINGQVAYSAPFGNDGSSVGYTNAVHLSAGDLVDFVLGPNGDYSFDGSAFNAVITALGGSSAPPADLVVSSLQTPSTLAPGVPASFIYTVANQGTGAAAGPWTDAVYLTPDPQGSQSFLLAAFLVTNSLAPGASLTLTQQIVLPASGPSGSLYFVFAADAGNAVTESNENNNTQAASSPVSVAGALTLAPAASTVAEDAPTGNLAVIVSRNGDVSAALSVNLQSSDGVRGAVPQSVVIPAGRASAAFFLTFHQDGQLTGPKTITLRAAAEGFQPSAADVIILDVDLPALSLALSPARITEGGSSTATLSRQGSLAGPLTVNLSGPLARLTFPGSVIIPAGQSATTFVVASVDDTTPGPGQTNILAASASGFVNGSGQLTVDDNDVPNLALMLARSVISEGDGPQATTGTLTRDRSSPQDLVVNLTSGNPKTAQTPATVTILAGQTSATFNIAAVDNNVIDGDRQVAIGASLLDPGTGLKLTDAPPVALRVTDDDGPTLKVSLATDVVAEGASPATTGTVSRNGAVSGPLTVALASSDTVHVKLPASIVIPAGAATAVFQIDTIRDNVTNGNQAVTISASAAGFTGSSRTLVVSDSSLPDLVIASVSIPPVVDTDAFFRVGLRVENHGPADSGTNFTQRVYLSTDPLLSSDDAALLENTFPGSIAAHAFFEQALQARSPQAPGDYWIIAVADAANVIPEMAENNNTAVSATPLHVRKAYGATVVAGIGTAAAGTPVPLHGQATLAASNAPAAFVTVDLSIRVRDTERHIAAITDASGNYATTFQPLPGEGGIYTVAADYPGITNSPTQAAFTLLGMRVAPAAATVRVGEGASLSLTNEVDNLADAPLSALTTTVVSTPSGVSIVPKLSASTLPASDAVSLFLQVSAAPGAASGTAIVRVKSAEGITADLSLPISVEVARAKLVAIPDALEAGMRRGSQTSVQLVVTNQGTLATGPLSILAPPVPWLKIASGSQAPSLAPGEAAVIALLLTPAPDLDLGPYTGSIVVKSDTAGVGIPFTFRNLSDSVGNLVITTVDEYTYYAAGSPKLTNALVTIRDAVTKDLVLTNVTGADGTLAITGLREAYYDIQITADGHGAFNKTGLVQAGKDNPLTAFLSRQTVRYIFSVVPTEIEDRTKIVITTEFETFVPIPVVTVDPPYFDLSQWSGTTATQVNVTLVNHGLLAANDVRLALPTSSDVEFTSLVSAIGDLPAQASLTIPIVIKPAGTASPARQTAGKLQALSAHSCYHDASFSFDLVCGPQVNTYNVPLRFDKLPGCGGNPPSVPWHFDPPQTGGGATGPGGGLGGWSDCPGCFAPGPFVFPPPLVTQPPQNCNPCLVGIGMAAVCVGVSGPEAAAGAARCFLGAASCAASLSEKPVSIGAALSCRGAFTSCFPSKPPGPWAAPLCLLKAKDCLPPALGGFGFGGGGSSSQFALRQSDRLAALSDSSVSNETPPEAQPLVRQLARALALLAPVTNYFGSIAWLNPAASDVDWAKWFGAFNAATEPDSPGGRQISDSELAQLMSLPTPVTGLQPTDVNAFIDRWNRTVDYYTRGIFTLAQVPAGASSDFIATDVDAQLSKDAIAANDAAIADGYSDAFTAAVLASKEFVAKANSAGGGSCAHVKLEIDQQAVITRDAFNATLEVANDTDDTLSDVSIELVMHNTNGDDTTKTFFVRDPVLQGVTAVDGTGQIAPHSTGKSSWILIPTSDAAPDGQVTHLVGGTLRYQQGGAAITVPLIAQAINVLPNAALSLKYFHQRDVFADDPFTDVIEPSVPFSLAVMIQNSGKGAARNVHITSAQPKIIDNKKGLLIDFSIIATDVDGQPLSPSLNADFGDINPGQIKIGRWLLKSTLQGLFTDYSASFENLDGLGDKRVALIQNVEIHELDHIVQADRTFEDGHPDFLANDVPDFNSYPDTIHLSQGSTAPVTVITNATPDAAVAADHLSISLSAAMPGGWGYLRVLDPGNGLFRLKEVRRSDGSIIALGTNVWVTDRTFIGFSQQPVRENVAHLLDYNAAAATVSYTFTYEPAASADSTPPTSSVSALAASSSTAIPVTWHGADDAGGTGIAYYDIYVAVDGGAFQPWLTKTTDSGALYPGQVGSSYAFYSVATDLAGNHEAAHASPDATTIVNLVNTAPIMTVAADAAVDEGAQVILNNSATDADIPANTLAWSLGAGAPAGALIDPATGSVTWNTSEATGPSTTRIPIIVRDNGLPSLSATGIVTVIVREVNLAPVVDAITNRVMNELQTLRFQAKATDPDIPANTLTFTLVNPPRGATISKDGLFNWQPDRTQGPSTNDIEIKVTDNGVPPLSTSQHFTVVVRDTEGDFDLGFESLVARTGGDYGLGLDLNSGLDLTSISCLVSLSSDRLQNLRIEPLVPELASAILIPYPTGGYSLQLQATPGQLLQGKRAIANLRFDAGTSAHSELVTVELDQVRGVRASGQSTPNGGGHTGRVVLIGLEPLVAIQPGASPTLELFGLPNQRYVIQQSPTADPKGSWPPLLNYTQTNLLQTLQITSGGHMNYYRLQQQ